MGDAEPSTDRRLAFFKGRVSLAAKIGRWTAVLFYAACVIVVWTFAEWRYPKPVQGDATAGQLIAKSLIALWTIGPPISFLAEYWLLSRKSADDLPDIEAFKYAQELGRGFWIAAVALLIAIYTGKLPGSSH